MVDIINAKTATISKIIGVKDSDFATLTAQQAVLSGWGEEIAESFYGILMEIPEAAAVLQEAGGGLDQRKTILAAWYRDIISGKSKGNFAVHAWLIGTIHIVVKVPNLWMIGMSSRVQELFTEKCYASFDAATAKSVSAAFRRLFSTITGLIAESYTAGYIDNFGKVGINEKLAMNIIIRNSTTTIKELRSKL